MRASVRVLCCVVGWKFMDARKKKRNTIAHTATHSNTIIIVDVVGGGVVIATRAYANTFARFLMWARTGAQETLSHAIFDYH